MAIKAVYKNPFGQSADAKLGPDNLPLLDMKEQYFVTTDNIADLDQVTACVAVDPNTGIKPPALGDRHPVYPAYLYCAGVNSARNDEAPTLWVVQVLWKTNQTGTLEGPVPKWNIQLEGDGIERVEDAYMALKDTTLDWTDSNLKPIVNTIGTTFDPVPTHVIYDEELSIQYNTLSLDLATVRDLRGAINADDVSFSIYGSSTIFKPGQVFVAKIRYGTEWGSGLQYWKVSVNLQFRYNDGLVPSYYAWDTFIPNRAWLWATTTDDINYTRDPKNGSDKTVYPVKDQWYIDKNNKIINGGNQVYILPFHLKRSRPLMTFLAGI